ncbi:outer membrane protein [Pelotalea chapellei]|uniref:Outer membrane beta-barrel protein n=1 Tax=Pelotalea chapellei TaxID=44671 RepID=A0ABS5U8N8_9BACT|nr:outer membrane beta-barrel protein [Pelotalea chapellei]MBT1072047.1 outer membrane beta-barrel protein [Pelotalea chapellei]
MKPISKMTIYVCLLLLLCVPARAEHTGPYVGILAGGSALMDAKASNGQESFKLGFNPGFQGSAVVGWDLRYDNPVGEGRIELEYNHRSNPLDKVSFVEGTSKGGGNLTADSLLLNCFAVFHNKLSWSPYVGIGVGAARIEANDLKVDGQALASDSTVVLAYQLGAGVDYPLTDYLNLDLGYRFFGSTKPKFTDFNGQKFGVDYFSHNLVLGLRLGF